MAQSLSRPTAEPANEEKSNKTGTMKAPEASPANGASPPATPSPAPANEANGASGLAPSPPALTNNANGRTPSRGGPARPPATPNATTTLAFRCLRLPTPSPSTTSDSPYMENLYRTGCIFGTERSAEPSQYRRSPKKRIRIEPPDVEEWLEGMRPDSDEKPLFAERPPPLDRPLSPTLAAPFMAPAQRLKRRRDKAYARCNGDAVSESEFSEDSDDATVGSDMDYNDLDAVSDVDPLGPPITENEEYYVNRDAIEPTSRSVKVLSTEEITQLCAQPQDLADVLFHEIRRLIWAARGRPRLLRKIYKLLSDSIAVIEMTKKVSYRLCFLERILEEHLPEFDDDGPNSILMHQLDARITTIEELYQPSPPGGSQQSGESPRSQETGGSSHSYQTGESSRSYQTGESSRSQEIRASSQQNAQATIDHDQVQIVLYQIDEEEEEYEEDEEIDEEVDEHVDPERYRENIRRGKAPARPNGHL